MIRPLQQLKKGIEVTRFKGLGEISPNEFKQFIGKDIRLIPVTINTFSDIKPTLAILHGKKYSGTQTIHYAKSY